MNDLFATHTAVAPALLVSLIHSVWIGGILYLFLRAYLDIMNTHASVSRYRATVAALFTQALLTIGVFAAIYKPDLSGATIIHEALGAVEITGTQKLAQGVTGTARDYPEPAGFGPSEIALLVYLSGVLFFFMRMIVVSSLVRNQVSRGHDAMPVYIRFLEQTRSALGIRRQVRLVISNHLQSPALYGFFRPVIIVPAGMLTHLTFEQVEVILLHELIHLKRADFLVNLFQQLVESLLFFNPFTWMISGLVREEREKRVDDAVTLHCNSATYAKALLNLSVLQCESPAAMMAANGGGQKLLLHRIQRILKVNHMKKELRARFYLPAIVAAGLILFISLSGFSSSLLHIDRQQTNPVSAAQAMDSDASATQRLTWTENIQGPVVFQSAPAEEYVSHVRSAVQMATTANLASEPVQPLPAEDTLTEKERKELIGSLERAKQELESVDWDEELARLEEERARVLDELPKLLQEEQNRLQEELSRIDREMIRKQMEQARIQLDSARQQLEAGELQQQVQQHMKQIEEQLRSGEYPNEKTREAMEHSLETLREIDLEKIMHNVQESISDMDLDMDFDYDLDMDIDLDSIRIAVRKNLQEIDIEEIKADIDRSIREIERQLEELKSNAAKKNQKN